MTAAVVTAGGSSARIAAALGRVYEAADWVPPPPEVRRDRIAARPVPLDRLIGSLQAVFEEVPGLTRATAAAHLLRWGVEQVPRLQDLLQDPAPLAGMLFANGSGGFILVRGDDPVPRRRFTAAHELGHLLLHFPPEEYGQPARDGSAPRAIMLGDEPEFVCEAFCDGGGGTESAGGDNGQLAPSLSLPWREREANRFAAELLMPEAVVRDLCRHYVQRYGPAPRFLEGHIATDLLVSRQAVRYRLADLGLGSVEAT